ncbi:MAG: hypothetical protein Q4F61_03115, partial [Candidatus Saccharibacteria bacterium]|nr:hypothetical protein [Candidatus Saccharibacteria bacterium]
ENLSFNKEETFAPAVKSNFPTKILNKLTSILGTLVLTLVAVLLFSKFATKLLKNFQAKDIFKNVLSGLGILILVPITAIFIMITVVGLPVALVALAFWLLLITFSTPVSGLVLGDILAKKVFKKEKMNLYLKATLG